MALPRRWTACAATAAALLAAACGGASTPAPRTAMPRPAPLPSAGSEPDRETVTVVSTGVGTFDLVAIPVALVRNDAAHQGAASLVVHFATSRNGAALGSLDATPVNLAPGETLPITADCTEACQGATAVAATLTVGAWTPMPGPALIAGAAAYACPGCGGSHAHGDVTGSLASTQVAQGAPVVVFAACSAADGSIVGGGSRQLVWPGGAAAGVDVAVLVDAPPVSCRLGASTGW